MNDLEVIITIKNADAVLPMTEAAEDVREHILGIFQDQVEDPFEVTIRVVTEIPITYKGKSIIKRCLYSIDHIKEAEE